jgi:predicted Fe-Mo cluster-binding NifX family protein
MAGSPVVITVAGGSDLQASVDPAFGRAARFLVVDVGTGQVLEAIENPATDAAHGAGIQAANLVGRIGAGAVISGRFGPKASAGLRSLGITMYELTGETTAAQALADLRSGKLRPH